VKSRTPQGARLFEVCDLAIDTCGVAGDATVELAPGNPIRVCPASTLAGAFIASCISGLAARELLDRGVDPPVFMSANLNGGDEHNAKLVEFMRRRTRGL
jgi:uncharacterized phosphosugar-binding protein